MATEHHDENVQIQVQLALLQQSVQTVLNRLDEQNKAMMAQADSLNTRWSHSLANSEARWQADLMARSALNDQKLAAINKAIDTKADAQAFHIVRGIVFGLVAIVLVAFASTVVKGVVAHDAKPAVPVVATVLATSSPLPLAFTERR